MRNSYIWTSDSVGEDLLFVTLTDRQLAKLLSGFVTGQIAVAKVVVTVAAQYLHGEND